MEFDRIVLITRTFEDSPDVMFETAIPIARGRRIVPEAILERWLDKKGISEDEEENYHADLVNLTYMHQL